LKLYDPVTQEELFEEMRRILEEDQIPLARTKGQDYCGPNLNEDSLQNVGERLGWIGAIREVGDKLNRLWSFIESGNLMHESVDDSLLDIINYAFYAKILYDRRVVDTSISHEPRGENLDSK